MIWLALLAVLVLITLALAVVRGGNRGDRNACPDCHEDDLLDCPTCGRTGTGW